MRGGRAGALIAWQRAAGDYWPYVCAAPFVWPTRTVAPSPDPAKRSRRVLSVLRELGGRPALFLDLPPERTLPWAPALSHAGYAVVPAIQRWCGDGAVVPGARLLSLLTGLAGDLGTAREARGVVFLLDGSRVGRPDIRPSPRRFDNRYAYSDCPFPPPALLRERGIDAVGWSGGIAPDVAHYAARLAAAGLPPRPVAV